MRLATFVVEGQERAGLVLPHPATQSDWVFDPALVEARLQLYASRGTSPYAVTRPPALGAPWPRDMVGLLSAGDRVTSALRRLDDFLRRFLEQADAYILQGAGWPVANVRLRAPVPRPRLFFGLVQNSPTVWRNTPERTHLNLFPQGHQRPQGSVIGPDDPILLPPTERLNGGWNPELGVIIGKGGRDIPVGEAMRHVAGLTIVSDVTFDYFRQDMNRQPGPHDWFEDAMSSWGDKKSDARTPMGPYLVTLDEIGNPYDLLIYTRQDGLLRDRSHTGAMSLGIERTISWLSSFRELHAGDVLHMGTMGYDGSPVNETMLASGESIIESEIEKLGVLRNPLALLRDESERERRVFVAPAVASLVDQGRTAIAAPDQWTPADARHFWTVFGNRRDDTTLPQRPYPRFLNAPATALAADGHSVVLPARATSLRIACELACVVGRLASCVEEDRAENYVLGYCVVAAIYDSSFTDAVIEPATPQERHLPAVYARWGDGFNIISSPLALPAAEVVGRNGVIEIDGLGGVTGETSIYRHQPAQVLAYISRYITLFPGDVIALGPLAEVILPEEETREAILRGYAQIDGIGSVRFQITRGQ